MAKAARTPKASGKAQSTLEETVTHLHRRVAALEAVLRSFAHTVSITPFSEAGSDGGGGGSEGGSESGGGGGSEGGGEGGGGDGGGSDGGDAARLPKRRARSLKAPVARS